MLPTQPTLRLPAIALIALAMFWAILLHAGSARASDSVSREVVNRINALRTQHGLAPLRLDPRLEQAGRAQSSAMMSRRVLSHGSPNGVARLTRLCRVMHANTIGETIGWIRYRSPSRQAAGIVRWWMRSPPHRAVLMSSNFHAIGVGRRTGNFGGHKAVWFSADLAG